MGQFEYERSTAYPMGSIEQYNRGHRVAAPNADLLTATALAEESLAQAISWP